jgi:transketolase N-terminal domain/subunit
VKLFPTKEHSMIEPTPQLQSWHPPAWRIRRYALRMGEVQGQGYIGQALGWADVLAVAYRHALNLRPTSPHGKAATASCSRTATTPSRTTRR